MDVKIEELKRVQTQVQYVNNDLAFPLDDISLEEWNKAKIAQEIGLEMLRNGLIELQKSESDDGSITTLKGRVTVYKKSEE